MISQRKADFKYKSKISEAIVPLIQSRNFVFSVHQQDSYDESFFHIDG